MSNNLDYWLQKCSICFDEKYDFCLNKCRDQFCKTCFDRYVQGLVSQSWGMSNVEIKCPVCSDHLPEEEWKLYVNHETVERFQQFHKQFSTFVRFCKFCQSEIKAVKIPSIDHKVQDEDFEAIVKRLRNSGLYSTKNLDLFDNAWKEYLHESRGSITTLYKVFLDGFKENTEHNIPRKRQRKSKPSNFEMWQLSLISSDLISLEKNPEAWKALQFSHIANLPQSKCNKCESPLCLKCGETSWHRGLTCAEFLAKKVATQKGSSDSLSALAWKLANSKPCPNCCIFITREEGCNKVDCVNCNFRFCWMCCREWSELCGFYKCVQVDGSASKQYSVTSASEVPGSTPRSEINHDNDKPELGVPDVRVIHTKFMI